MKNYDVETVIWLRNVREHLTIASSEKIDRTPLGEMFETFGTCASAEEVNEMCRINFCGDMEKMIFAEMYADAEVAIKDAFECYTGYYCDFHNEVFNTDSYITYTNDAKAILGEYAFDAIAIIQEYETEHFGERFTDFSDPVSVCNMLYYIIGEEVLDSGEGKFRDLLCDVWQCSADEETNKKLLKFFLDEH